MTTAVTSPAPGRTPGPDAGTALFGVRSGRHRRPVTTVAVVTVLVLAALVFVTDVQGRSAVRASQASLETATGQLRTVQARLTRAQKELTDARHRHRSMATFFDAAQATLSVTQKTLAQEQAGLDAQGVDLSSLDTCLSAVEQALNQIAVGQTSGGLATLQASSSSCTALGRAA